MGELLANSYQLLVICQYSFYALFDYDFSKKTTISASRANYRKQKANANSWLLTAK